MEAQNGAEERYYMVLAGGLGWKYESVLRLIESSEYKDNIIMTGFISQKESNVCSKVRRRLCIRHYMRASEYLSLRR